MACSFSQKKAQRKMCFLLSRAAMLSPSMDLHLVPGDECGGGRSECSSGQAHVLERPFWLQVFGVKLAHSRASLLVMLAELPNCGPKSVLAHPGREHRLLFPKATVFQNEQRCLLVEGIRHSVTLSRGQLACNAAKPSY